MRKKKPLIAYISRLGAFLVNKSWDGSFMSMNFSLLALLRLDWVICMTGILKSLPVIYLGKKLGEKLLKDTPCQNWLFLSADNVEVMNIGSLRVNIGSLRVNI